MAFLFVTPNEIQQASDDKGNLITLRVNCTELAPRNFNINLIKQPAHVRQQFQTFVDAKQPIMVPVKEGRTSEGQPYFMLEPGQIIPVSLDYVKTLQAQHDPVSVSSVVELSPVAEADSKVKPAAFGDLNKRAASTV